MDHHKFEIPADLEVSLNRYRRTATGPSLATVILWALIVVLAVFIGRVLYTKYMIHEVTQGLEQFNSQMQANLQAQSERARQQQLAIEQERTRRTQLEIQAKQAETDRQLAIAAEARQKETAWDSYFKHKRPKWCDETSTQAAVVECGNIYMRERAKFEKRWGAGADRLVIR